MQMSIILVLSGPKALKILARVLQVVLKIGYELMIVNGWDKSIPPYQTQTSFRSVQLENY